MRAPSGDRFLESRDPWDSGECPRRQTNNGSLGTPPGARAMSFLRRKRRGEPVAAPAAETAPPSPPPASPTRDGYGFVVKPAFADAYRAHVPMFVKEEDERRERWMAFLERASDPTSPVAAGYAAAASASGDARDARGRGARRGAFDERHRTGRRRGDPSEPRPGCVLGGRASPRARAGVARARGRAHGASGRDLAALPARG